MAATERSNLGRRLRLAAARPHATLGSAPAEDLSGQPLHPADRYQHHPSREHATGGCHIPGRTTPPTAPTRHLAPLEARTYPIRISVRLPSRSTLRP